MTVKIKLKDEVKTCYKVVTKDLKSITSFSGYRLKYSTVDYTIPKDKKSFLFAFKTKQAAEYTMSLYCWEGIIYECECHGVVELNNLNEDVWYPVVQNKEVLDSTVFARGIKLIKPVSNPEDDIFLKENSRFKWIECGHTYDVVLAQVGCNEFMVFSSDDLNRMRGEKIIPKNKSRHGVCLTELKEFAAEFDVTINYAGE